MESLNETIMQLKKEIVDLKEGKIGVETSGDQVSAEQHQLLVLKLSVKDDEIERLQEEYRRADGEREMCLKKVAELQEDNQELIRNITIKEEVGMSGIYEVEMQRVGGEAIEVVLEDEGSTDAAETTRRSSAKSCGATGRGEEAEGTADDREAEGGRSHV